MLITKFPIFRTVLVTLFWDIFYIPNIPRFLSNTGYSIILLIDVELYSFFWLKIIPIERDETVNIYL